MYTSIYTFIDIILLWILLLLDLLFLMKVFPVDVVLGILHVCGHCCLESLRILAYFLHPGKWASLF